MLKLVLFKEISPDIIQDLTEKILKSDEKEVLINLNSQGGEVFSAFAFYNVIKSEQIALTVNVVGACSSSAITILLSGETRRASKIAEFLLHPMSRRYEKASLNAKELKGQSQDLQRMEKKSDKIERLNVAKELKKRGKTKKEIEKVFRKINKLVEKETKITATQAYEFGYLTERPYDL